MKYSKQEDSMKRTLRDLWVATLRSGNYKQGKGSLRTKDNRCCCLGVLCDIVGRHKLTMTMMTAEGLPSAELAVTLRLSNARNLEYLLT